MGEEDKRPDQQKDENRSRRCPVYQVKATLIVELKDSSADSAGVEEVSATASAAFLKPQAATKLIVLTSTTKKSYVSGRIATHTAMNER